MSVQDQTTRNPTAHCSITRIVLTTSATVQLFFYSARMHFQIATHHPKVPKSFCGFDCRGLSVDVAIHSHYVKRHIKRPADCHASRKAADRRGQANPCCLVIRPRYGITSFVSMSGGTLPF